MAAASQTDYDQIHQNLMLRLISTSRVSIPPPALLVPHSGTPYRRSKKSKKILECLVWFGEKVFTQLQHFAQNLMKMSFLGRTVLTVSLLSAVSTQTQAQLFSDNFDVDSTASWTVNGGPSDEFADFFFDYSTVGIPSAPNSTGGSTRGVKLYANHSSGVFGGFSVSPTGQSFSGNYEMTFDMWLNFNGPAPVGGSGSTQLGGGGIGTSGTVAQWPGGTQDSIWFAATADGNSSSDWRAYSPTAATSYTAASGVYAAGTGTSPDARNHSHPYYAGFGGVAAPAAQLTLFPQQTGTTLVGSAGWEWHEVSILKLGSTVTWTVDGLLIATVNLADDTANTGENILLMYSDTNATSSTDPNDTALLFGLFDNVLVTAVPEPSTVTLAVCGGLGMLMLFRRRK